ncbi:MAG: DUF4296 domain-containing protein [Bacteroidaceae bacterium]|nr:DUF4296 domain-containing protein [Bacteroidaceae bacterium]
MKHLFKDIKHIAAGLATLIWLSACTVEVPSHIIQPDEMENLLYDYHLMQALAGDLKTSEGYKRKQYEQYVFDKHHVTEAEFDTSLTWYMRHTKELEAIYKKLNNRFSDKKEELAAHIPPYERSNRMSEPGDTVDVWDDFRLTRLTASPLTNKMTFILPADSNYHQRDSFEWKLNAHFLGDTAVSRAVMGLTLLYDKDTIGLSQQIDSTGIYTLSLACDSAYKLEEIHGHVYYYERKKENKGHTLPDNNKQLPSFRVLPVADLLLSDIAIMRYHRAAPTEADTTSAPEENPSKQEALQQVTK